MYLVYVTCANIAEAEKIAAPAITQRLAACVNIFQPHQSLYLWDGKVQNEQEVAVIFKTSKETYPALEAAIMCLHPYDTPCIVAIEAQTGSQDFMDWVNRTTNNNGT